ncbi:hypothetical protein [Sinomonas sp. P10A9]|uniref:Uncharacterized protein n=1 Tax=Sinomonas puerhi TaxID=3238584 RepID=A0AB39L7M1_9MICC
MSEDPRETAIEAGQPEVEAALAGLASAADQPLAAQADAFEAFHAALMHVLDAEPAE